MTLGMHLPALALFQAILCLESGCACVELLTIKSFSDESIFMVNNLAGLPVLFNPPCVWRRLLF